MDHCTEQGKGKKDFQMYFFSGVILIFTFQWRTEHNILGLPDVGFQQASRYIDLKNASI